MRKRTARWMLWLLLALSMAGLSMTRTLYAAPADEWQLQGKVFAGDLGDESTPLSGVTVAEIGRAHV